MSIIDGKIEIMTKLSKVPEPEIDEKTKNRFFKISNGSFKVCVTLTEKMWNRIPEGAAKFESWVCAINGKIKNISENEIYLEEPAIQVFENQKKPKPEEKPQQQQHKHHNNHQHKKHPNDKNPNKLNIINNQQNQPREKKELEIKTVS